ncbi:MAG: hypothetical protein ISS51_01850 [Dehalococcoidales bacterium]|nr:hypothetical protein [Dehalococcoidales bacterium]
MPHTDWYKVLPTTALVARDKSGKRDRDYPFPSLDHLPNQTSLFLSFCTSSIDI